MRLRWLISGLLVSSVALCVAPAPAHSVLVAPTPRDNSDSNKDPSGPCGPKRYATQPQTRVAPGDPVVVRWTETVDHPGCFVVDLARANDAAWEQLVVVTHATQGTAPRDYQTTVALPADLACDECTIRVRQIMLAAETPDCPPANVANGATYYSCANVRTTEIPDAGAAPDAGADDASLAWDGDRGGHNPEGSADRETPASSSGCATAPGGSASGGALLAVVLVLGSVRRRSERRRRDSTMT